MTPRDAPCDDRGKTVYRCRGCGSRNVQLAMWYRPNLDQVVDDFGSYDSTDTTWCEDCEGHEGTMRVDWKSIDDEQLELLMATLGALEDAADGDREIDVIQNAAIRAGILWRCHCGRLQTTSLVKCRACEAWAPSQE